MLGMYEEAVWMAMMNSQNDLAKNYANKPESKQQRTNLWLA